MRISCADWNLLVEIVKGKETVIQIENPVLATEVIQNLCSQAIGEDGKIWFSIDEKEASLCKMGEVILNPFSLDFSNRKIQNKLFQEMKELANDYCSERVGMLKSYTVKCMEEICDHMLYNISYEDSFDITALFKMLGVQLDYANDSFSDTICSYVKIMKQLCGTELFIFVNISQFLSDEQWDYLKKDLSYLEAYILFIELRVHHDFDKDIIIDKDLCVIQ